MAGTVAAQCAVLAGNAIAARILGAETYGAYGLTLSSAAMIATLAAAGMAMIITRGVARRAALGDPAAVESYIRHCLTVTGLLWAAFGAVLLLSADWFAQNVLHTAHAAKFLVAAVALGLPLAFTQIGYAALAGLNVFRDLAKLRAFTGICGAVLLVASALSQSVFAVIGTAVISSTATSWLAVSKSLGQARVAASGRRATSPDGGVPGSASSGDGHLLLPAIATGVMSIPVIWLCQTIAGGSSGGLAPFAAIAVITMWSQGVLLVPTNIGQPLFPAMVHALGRGTIDGHPGRLLWSSMALIGGFTLPLCAGLFAVSNPLLGVYGPAFAAYGPAFGLLIGAAAIQSLSIPALVTLQADGRMWLHFLSNLLWAGVFIGLTLSWRSQGVTGYAQASLLAFVVHAILVNAWALLRLRAPMERTN